MKNEMSRRPTLYILLWPAVSVERREAQEPRTQSQQWNGSGDETMGIWEMSREISLDLQIPRPAQPFSSFPYLY